MYRIKNNKSSARGLNLEMSVLAGARAQLLNMLYMSTHLSVPWIKYLEDCSIYTAISRNVVGENDECQLSNGDCTTEKNCGY